MSKVRKLYQLPTLAYDALGKENMDKVLGPFLSGLAVYAEASCVEWDYVRVDGNSHLLLVLDSATDTEILEQDECIVFGMGVLLMGALGDFFQEESRKDLQEELDKMDFNDFMNEMLK